MTNLERSVTFDSQYDWSS